MFERWKGLGIVITVCSVRLRPDGHPRQTAGQTPTRTIHFVLRGGSGAAASVVGGVAVGATPQRSCGAAVDETVRDRCGLHAVVQRGPLLAVVASCAIGRSERSRFGRRGSARRTPSAAVQQAHRRDRRGQRREDRCAHLLGGRAQAMEPRTGRPGRRRTGDGRRIRIAARSPPRQAGAELRAIHARLRACTRVGSECRVRRGLPSQRLRELRGVAAAAARNASQSAVHR